jgi:VanZ family protein
MVVARVALATWATLLALNLLINPSPAAGIVVMVEGGDLTCHAAGYAVLALLALPALPRVRWHRRLLLAGCSAVGFGTLLECLQPLTGRTFAVADLLANLVGVLAALIVAHVLWSISRKRWR